MNDKQMLELAAKAIGFEFRLNLVNAGQLFKDDEYVCFWKPLTDDGDALRLAVALQIQHKQVIDFVVANVGYDGEVRELIGSDPYAATRRAITRAAAEIGKSL